MIAVVHLSHVSKPAAEVLNHPRGVARHNKTHLFFGIPATFYRRKCGESATAI